MLNQAGICITILFGLTCAHPAAVTQHQLAPVAVQMRSDTTCLHPSAFNSLPSCKQKVWLGELDGTAWKGCVNLNLNISPPGFGSCYLQRRPESTRVRASSALNRWHSQLEPLASLQLLLIGSMSARTLTDTTNSRVPHRQQLLSQRAMKATDFSRDFDLDDRHGQWEMQPPQTYLTVQTALPAHS